MKKPSKTTVINKNDDLARKLNLIVHGNKCERCGRSGELYQMHWSHVFSRETKRIRWDMDNCMVHCSLCHRWWHHYPTESAEWFDYKWPGRKQRLRDKINKAAPNMSVLDYLQIQSELKATLQSHQSS